MQQFSRKENFLIANTLNCIPVLLKEYPVLIDLRNETSIAGIVDNADGHMNIHLRDCVLINRLGEQYPFEHFMVRERMIRQIHIPEQVNMSQMMKEWCDRGCSLRPPNKREKQPKRVFKQKRAEERHKEILKEIESQKESKQQAE